MTITKRNMNLNMKTIMVPRPTFILTLAKNILLSTVSAMEVTIHHHTMAIMDLLDNTVPLDHMVPDPMDHLDQDPMDHLDQDPKDLLTGHQDILLDQLPCHLDQDLCQQVQGAFQLPCHLDQDLCQQVQGAFPLGPTNDLSSQGSSQQRSDFISSSDCLHAYVCVMFTK
jgi:hypothetical protein